MKKIFFVGFVCISIFALSVSTVSAFGGWNSGGAATINNVNYNYNPYISPMNYGYNSYYQQPVVNYGYNNNWNGYGGYVNYMPSYFGNNWNQGLGIGATMNMGWNIGGFMPVGYGGGYGMGYGNNWNGGCSMNCYGSPIFY